MGALLAIGSLIAWLIDRFTRVISTFLGKLACGDCYLQAVDGVIGDVSCGFNADMYLTASLVFVLIVGAILFIRAKSD
ncbi:MAG: hypothetical protein U9Q71_09370 [Pseudomonadota bacterium]|nr:hypothetical protein [Pseudomonadota bacterium]